jgi:RNA-directed DNA polymerase
LLAGMMPSLTRLIEFGRHAAASRKRQGLSKPETFNFLGFTFICGTSRAGRFLIKRKTRRDRMRAKLKAIKQELRRWMHRPIPEQGRWLKQVVAGYCRYFAVPTNSRALANFRDGVVDRWRRLLGRRSQKGRLPWTTIAMLVDHWIPHPRILLKWPEQRFAVTHPR